MAAKVGLLSRNIRIEGESYDDVMEESFGARVLASSYYEDETNVKKTGMESNAHTAYFPFRLIGDTSAILYVMMRRNSESFPNRLSRCLCQHSACLILHRNAGGFPNRTTDVSANLAPA